MTETMSVSEFRKLVRNEKARQGVKHVFIVIDGIAYGEEDYESYLFHSWLTAKGLFAQHTPNERKCSPQEMVKLKSMGLLPGASDHLIFDSPPLFPHIKGVAVEMKTETGKATEPQKIYQEELRKRGWYCEVCHTAKRAIKFMEMLGF